MIRLRVLPKTLGMAPAEAAAYWAVVQDRGDLSAREQAEFAAWHADPANAEAYARADGAISAFDGDDGSDPHLRALRQAALEAAPAPRRRFPIAAALAAACLAGIVTVTTLDHPGGSAPTSETIAAAPAGRAVQAGSPGVPNEYATAVGERRSFRLSDGSTVTLNTRSRLTVAFSQGRRLVRLVQGQALFEVAHDSARPFTVEAADRQITALGTVFEVRIDPGRLHVVLVEGRVVVDRASESGSTEVAPALLRPGQEYVVALGAAQQVASVDVARQLLWRDGFVEFDDEPLGRAVAEMNRYTDRPIVLGDDGVAALRLSGVFRTGSPDRFVNTVSEILPIEVQPAPQGGLALSLESGARR